MRGQEQPLWEASFESTLQSRKPVLREGPAESANSQGKHLPQAHSRCLKPTESQCG